MGDSMTIKEYLEQHKGTTCIEYGTLFIGMSDDLDGELFFYHKEDGRIKGPYMFGLAYEHMKELITKPMTDNFLTQERIKEKVIR
ncbi:hypothetical protein OB985_04150 [Bacillus cereus]|nr:hypothetical protein [Bacillus cereus]